MKKLLLIILAILLSSCTIKNTQNVQIEDKKSSVLKVSSENKTPNIIFVVKSISDIEFAYKMKIKDIVISTDGVRIDDANYRTDFKSLKNLDMLVYIAKSKSMNFFIEVNSGPGYNIKKGNYEIYKKNSQRYYFSQMLKEIHDRYRGVKGFKGLSVKIQYNDPNLYYETINYLYEKLEDTTLIYNIQISNFNNRVSLKSLNYINTVNLNFNILEYPGYSIVNNSNFEINRNIILNSLQKFKKDNHRIIIRVDAPWKDEHDVFFQDLYEISRMLNFNIALDNTSAIHKSKKLLKIIRKMNGIN